MLLDIHSHILPAVDDGAFDISESLMLLEAMRVKCNSYRTFGKR